MESLRRLMSRKENHPWEVILIEWEHLVGFSVATQDRNPWKEWCRSWEVYEKCHSKPPKSGRKKEAVWRELYYIAKKTADNIDEATGMSQQLKSQNTAITFLQQKVTAIDQQLKNQYAELKNFQEENLLLKKKCESLQNKLNYEQNEKIVDDYQHKHELEKEVNQRQTAEKEIKRLSSTLLKDLTQIENLKDQISALNGQLLSVKEEQDINVKYIINQYYEKLTINYPTQKQFAIQGIEGEESWYYKARKAGVGCPSRYKIWKRLEKYEDPRETVDNAPYWQLLVRLSRFEDLETGERRYTFKVS